MKSLSEVIHPNRRFSRSINAERDQGGEALRGYLPTGRAVDVVSRVSRGFSDASAGRAFSITGPHGGGKSSLAVFIDSLLSPAGRGPRETALELVSTVDQAAAEITWQGLASLDPRGEGFVRAIVTAHREPIRRTVARALHSAAERDLGPRQRLIPKHFAQPAGDLDAAEILDAVIKVADIRPAFLLIDEFGKNLEAYVDSGADGDLYLLQQLAELGQGSQALPFTIMTLQHLSFDEYVADATTQRRREWAKVQGRFQDVPYVESNAQSRKLMSAAIEHDSSPIQAAVRSWAKKNQSRYIGLGLRDVIEEAPQAYPLHPIALAVLPDLCSRYGQNERTLFSFLGGPEPLAVPAFLESASWKRGEPLPFVGLDRVYDYFLDSAGTSLGASAAASRWLEIEHRIRDAIGISDDERSALKTIGVLNLVSTSGTLRASEQLVLAALEAPLGTSTESERRHVLAALQAKGLVTYREYSDEYRIWQGSDFDLKGQVELARASLRGASLADLLSMSVALDPVVAGRNSQETGILRTFERRFLAPNQEMRAPEGGDPWDGVLYLATHTELQSSKKLAPGTRPVVIAVPASVEGVEAAALETAALQATLDSAHAEAADWVARRELSERLALARQRLSELIAARWSMQGVRWRFVNTASWLPTGLTTSGALSLVCDRVYSESPKLANEMIAKRELTSQGAKARRLLIEAMIEKSDQEAFGLEGYGPERAMYEAVFRSTGLHRQQGRAWAITQPSDLRWSNAWSTLNEAIDACDVSRRGLDEISGDLKAAPIGLKDGVIPLLVMTALVNRERDVALYEHGSLVMKLDDAVAERLARNPGHFTVKNLATDGGPRKAAVASLSRTLIQGAEDRDLTFLQVARAIFRELRELPPYSQQTKKGISATAQEVRDLFRSAIEPDVLFFEQLPMALGVTEFSARGKADHAQAEAFSSGLTDALLELKGHFPSALTSITHLLAEATASTTRELPELQRRLAGQAVNLADHVLDPRLRAFLGALSRDQLPPEAWLQNVAMVVADGHSPRSWNDEIAEQFGLQIAELGGALRRTQALLYERVAAGGQVFESRRVTITRPDGTEEVEIVALTEAENQLIDGKLSDPLNGLVEVLGSEDAVRRAVLAWIALKHTGSPVRELDSPSPVKGESA
jgi:hypothetical protein